MNGLNASSHKERTLATAQTSPCSMLWKEARVPQVFLISPRQCRMLVTECLVPDTSNILLNCVVPRGKYAVNTRVIVIFKKDMNACDRAPYFRNVKHIFAYDVQEARTL